ncbi:MAG: hypothetical protein SGCHY_005298, partial [Lobulomycetales sp.]
MWELDCSNTCARMGSANYTVEDRCGECGGSNECVDCRDIAFGTNYIDVCGNCLMENGLLPGNESANCFAIAGAEPSVIPNAVGTVMSLYGAGFTYETVFQINGQTLTPNSLQDDIVTFVLSETLPSSGLDIGTAQIDAFKATQSNGTIVKYYDPAASSLSFIDPTRVFTAATTTFNITGTNILPNLESPICVFTSNTTGLSLSAPLTVSPSRSFALCTQSFPVSGDIDVSVLYSTPKYPTEKYSVGELVRPEYFVAEAYDLDVRVRAEAPVPESAVFDATGAAIYFDFDRAFAVLADKEEYRNTDITTELNIESGVNCSYIFENSDLPGRQLWRTGSESDCTATQVSPTRLVLKFLGDFTLDSSTSPIIPNNNITILPDAIVASNVTYSMASTGSLLVNEPNPKPMPVVVISAAQLIGSCVNYEMDLSSSYGSAGRNWKSVEVNYTSLSSSPAFTYNRLLMNANLSAQALDVASGIASKVVLDRDIVDADTYTFSVTFVNFLGGSTTQFVKLEKIEADDIPYIVLTSDNGVTSLDVSEVQILRAASVPIPGCGVNGANVEFEWFFKRGTVNNITLPNVETKSSLVLDSYAMLPDAGYTFEVLANFNYSSNRYPFSIDIGSAKDVIFSSAGVSKSVGTANELILSAEIENKAYETLDYDIFQCNWLCFDEADRPCVSSVDNLGVTIGDCRNNNLTSVFAPGLYRLSVIVTNTVTGSTDAGDVAYLTILGGKVPAVTIKPSELSPGSFSTTFNLLSEVDASTVDGELTYQWSMPDTCFGESYTTIPLTQDVTIATNPEQANLKFLPGKLSPGITYCIRLIVTDSLNSVNKGETTMIVKIRDAPFAGRCTVSANSGRAFNTDFEFSCNGWVTDPLSLPMNFIFFIRKVGQQGWSQLAPRGSSSVFSTKMAAGTYEIRPQVIDTASSISEEIIIPLELTNSVEKRDGVSLWKRSDAAGCTDATTFIQEQVQEFEQSKNVVNFNSKISVALNALPLTSDSTAIDTSLSECKALQVAILDALDALLKSQQYYLESQRAAGFIGGIMQGVNLGNEDTTAEVATKIFLLLKEITKDITANSPRTCYPYDTAEQFFSTLGNLFASSENRAELVSEVADGWKDTVDEVTACQALNQICGQSQATFTGTSLVHGYGVQDSGDAQTFCTKFEVRDFGSAAGLQGCMRYECISYTELATISTSEILDDLNLAMSEIAEFNFLNSALDKVSLVNGNVKMSIDLEQHVIDDQQLSGYNAANPVDGQSILRPARLVLHANGSVGYDTSGIQVVSGETNENTVTFE